MKYIIVDIDGTVADSRHRSHLLPAYPDKIVTRKSDGQDGIIQAMDEHRFPTESGVQIAWRNDDWSFPDEGIWYPWTEFMGGDQQRMGVMACRVRGRHAHRAQHLFVARDAPKAADGQYRALLSHFARAKWRQPTVDWLKKHDLFLPDQGDILHMRDLYDMRKDTEFKGELIDQERASGKEFIFGLDDKRVVANMLRSKGIPALHVADY